MQKYTANGNGESDDFGTYYRVNDVSQLQAESATKIAALEQQLAAMTADRNLWQDQHNGDCPNLARVAELERRCLIAEEAIGDACKWLDMAGTEHIVLQNTEHRLICDGKLPQIEVKP